MGLTVSVSRTPLPYKSCKVAKLYSSLRSQCLKLVKPSDMSSLLMQSPSLQAVNCKLGCNFRSSVRARAISDGTRSPLRVRSPPPAEYSAELPKKSGWIEEQLSEEQLESTLEHKLWVGSAGVLLLCVAGRGVLEVDSIGDSVQAMTAAVGGYAILDLLSGVYHWGIDNYGSSTTPLVGKQIEGFLGHHERPWTITHREFCNNVHTICKPAILVALLMLALDPPLYADIFVAVGTSMAILSQQFHSWAHTKKRDIPPVVAALQDAGLLVSPVEHCQHHKQPFNSNYCIVGGFWNQLLDTSGVFPAWEKVIYENTGVAPRCWDEENSADISYYGKDTELE